MGMVPMVLQLIMDMVHMVPMGLQLIMDMVPMGLQLIMDMVPMVLCDTENEIEKELTNNTNKGETNKSPSNTKDY